MTMHFVVIGLTRREAMRPLCRDQGVVCEGTLDRRKVTCPECLKKLGLKRLAPGQRPPQNGGW